MQYSTPEHTTEIFKLAAATPKPTSQKKYEDYKSQKAREGAEFEGQPLHVRSPVLRALKGGAKGAFKEVSEPTLKKFSSAPETNEHTGVSGFVLADPDTHAAERAKPLKKLAGKASQYKEHFKNTMKSKGVDPENIGAHDKDKVKGAFKSVDKKWNAVNEPGKDGKTAHVIDIYKEAFAQEKEGNVLRETVKHFAPKLDKRIADLAKKLPNPIPKGGFLGAAAKASKK